MTALKFMHEEDKGVMHYVTFEGKLVGLSVHDSKKIAFIKSHGFLNIAFDLKDTEFYKVNVSIVTDEDYVRQVYQDMLQKDNTYFKEGMKGLCVLVFEK